MSTEQNMSLTPFNKLHFRKQSDVKVTETSRQDPRTKTTRTYINVENDKGFPSKYLSPPCTAKWCHANEGGNFEKTDFSRSKETSYINVTLKRDGDNAEHSEETRDFFTRMEEVNASVLQQLAELNPSKVFDAQLKKAQKFYKKKTPEEQRAKAMENFIKAAMVPIKVDRDGETVMNMRVKAFNYDMTPKTVRHCHVVVKNGRAVYEQMPENVSLNNGALLSVPFQVSAFVMSKDKYGITYRMIPDIIVFEAGQGGNSIPVEIMETPMRPYVFSTGVSKRGNTYVNTDDPNGVRLTTRFPPTEVLFSDLGENGTLGKFGATEANAKFAAVLKEAPTPESKAFFDYAEKLSDDALQFLLTHPDLLAKAKEELKQSATEIAADSGEPYEDCYKSLAKEMFNNPLVHSEHGDHRTLKITARAFGYRADGDPAPPKRNVLPLQDADGNDITGSTPGRGAVIAPVCTPGFYFMPDGACGMRWDISLQHGIRVHSNPDGDDSDGEAIYTLKRSAPDTEAPESKRMRVE